MLHLFEDLVTKLNSSGSLFWRKPEAILDRGTRIVPHVVAQFLKCKKGIDCGGEGKSPVVIELVDNLGDSLLQLLAGVDRSRGTLIHVRLSFVLLTPGPP